MGIRIRLAVVLALGLQSTVAAAVTVGDQAPAWVGLDMTRSVQDAQVQFPQVLQGRPAVLLFWATWCPYCKAFMPYAKQIQADYAAAGVQFLTFNTKERGLGDPRAYVRSLDFPMVAIADADAIAQQYNVQFIPGLMVVDGAGKVIYRRASTDLPAGKTVAQQWADEVRATLNALLRSNIERDVERIEPVQQRIR